MADDGEEITTSTPHDYGPGPLAGPAPQPSARRGLPWPRLQAREHRLGRAARRRDPKRDPRTCHLGHRSRCLGGRRQRPGQSSLHPVPWLSGQRLQTEAFATEAGALAAAAAAPASRRCIQCPSYRGNGLKLRLSPPKPVPWPPPPTPRPVAAASSAPAIGATASNRPLKAKILICRSGKTDTVFPYLCRHLQ